MRLHSFGDPAPLAVEDIPCPRPAAGQLLVRLVGTSVNPVDVKIRDGDYRPVSGDQLPITLGRDIAGRIAVAAGAFTVGQEVYGLADFEHGTYADLVLARPESVAPKPETLSLADAGTVPLAALTAWQGLFTHGGLSAGQRVLIHGGAGGVGTYAVQFARAVGAEVVATASARDHAFLREIGAATTVDHRAERFEARAGACDLVLDLVGGETLRRSYGVLKRGGAIVSVLEQPDADRLGAVGARFGRWFVTAPSGADLARIGALIDAGRVRAVVAERFDLAHVADAQARLKRGGVRGKIAIAIG